MRKVKKNKRRTASPVCSHCPRVLFTLVQPKYYESFAFRTQSVRVIGGFFLKNEKRVNTGNQIYSGYSVSMRTRNEYNGIITMHFHLLYEQRKRYQNMAVLLQTASSGKTEKFVHRLRKRKLKCYFYVNLVVVVISTQREANEVSTNCAGNKASMERRVTRV